MRILGIIPARGGSRGIPGKNLALVAGRPLISYTFDAARASRRLARAIVSTDSDAVAALARAEGIDVPFLRPAELAGDDTAMLPVLQHAIDALGGERPDAVVLLQPTSPLRRPEHIDEAIDLFERSGADSVVSVTAVPHQFTPGSLMQVEENGRLVALVPGPAPTRRQDKPLLYARNGPAVLVTRTAVLDSGRLYGDTVRPYVMSRQDSLDVDEPFDLELVEAVLTRRLRAAGAPVA